MIAPEWISKALMSLFYFYLKKNFAECIEVFLVAASVVNGEGYLAKCSCVLAVFGEEGGEVTGDVVGAVLENAATPCA